MSIQLSDPWMSEESFTSYEGMIKRGSAAAATSILAAIWPKTTWRGRKMEPSPMSDLLMPILNIMFMQIGLWLFNTLLRSTTSRDITAREERRQILKEIDEFCDITDPDLVTH